MGDEIKRLNYFDHQFLQAVDFNEEQAYHIQMRHVHNKILHQWGIADGLAVTLDSESGEERITVTPGVALDTNGCEMIIDRPRDFYLKDMPDTGEVYIIIQYDEKQTHPSSEGAEGPTRWTENPKTDVLPSRPQDEGQQIILAKVILNGNGAPDIKLEDRRQAGVKGGDLRARSLTLSKRTEPNGNGEPRLIPSGEKDIELEGGLKITNGLKITGGNLTVEGDTHFLKNVSIGTKDSDDKATLKVEGTIKADKIIVTEEEGFCHSSWFEVKTRTRIDNIDNPFGKDIGGFQMFFKRENESENEYMVAAMSLPSNTNGYSLIYTKENFIIFTGTPSVCVYLDETGKIEEDKEGWYRFVAWKMRGENKIEIDGEGGQKYEITK